MRRPVQLSSLDNPRLKRIVHLRKHRDRRETGLFVAEGRREIGRALGAGLRMVELFWSPQLTGVPFDTLPSLLPGLPETLSPFEVTPALLTKIAYRENPEGYIAVFEQPTWSLDDVPAVANPLFLVASDTAKPGNLGAMARTAAAAGVTAMLVADEQVDAFNPNAIRASTGAVFTLPVISEPADRLISYLRDRGARIVAASPDADRSYTDADLTGPLAIAVGAEDVGLNRTWREAADVLVRIPMRTDAVDSLNASNAAAVLLFQAVRQRGDLR